MSEGPFHGVTLGVQVSWLIVFVSKVVTCYIDEQDGLELNDRAPADSHDINFACMNIDGEDMHNNMFSTSLLGGVKSFEPKEKPISNQKEKQYQIQTNGHRSNYQLKFDVDQMNSKISTNEKPRESSKKSFAHIIPSQYQQESSNVELPKEPFTLDMGPGEHQIKEYNIHPVNVLTVKYNAQSSDIVLVKLVCDKDMNREDPEIFLVAVSPKFSPDDSNRIFLPNLKISKEMLRGRTKGFKFRLEYSLLVKGEAVYKILSDSFYLWSNVNQTGFPRELREGYVNQTESIKKKRKRN